MSQPHCIICDAEPRKPYSRGRLATWWKCPGCGLFFVHPQPDDETLGRLYQAQYYEQKLEDSAAAIAKSDRYWGDRAERLAAVVKVERALDVGCGKGQFLRAGLARGWDIVGTELDASALRALPEELRERSIVAPLERAPFEAGTFDAVTLFDVIEHVRQPIEVLEYANRLLRSGGVVMITTPNAAVLKAKLRGRFWKYFNFERYLHLYHFTPRTITMALESADFEADRWFSDGMPMIVAARTL